jgi:RNA-directed DNA polymerase
VGLKFRGAFQQRIFALGISAMKPDASVPEPYRLREVFRRYQSQPAGRLIAEINPILRGWVNYFRIGNASRCLAYVRLWVEQRVRRHLVRRHLMRARGRRGFGWKRWSTAWFHERLGLFGDYRVRYWAAPESAPGR